jgi:tetratricopeptide (TPR) repeat protein
LEDNGDGPAALESHRQALVAAQHFLDAHPSDSLACHDLATSYNNIGHLLAKAGRVREGLDIYLKGLAVCKWVSTEDPNSTQANSRGWLDDYREIGGMQTQLRNRKEAFANYQKATQIGRRLHEADTNNVQGTMDLASCYQDLGDSQRAFGYPEAAAKSYQEAASLQEQAHVRDARNVEVITSLASSYSKLGQAYSLLAKKTQAPGPRVERLRQARWSFEKSWRLWIMMEKAHSLPANQESQSHAVAKEMTECDVSLANLGQHE